MYTLATRPYSNTFQFAVSLQPSVFSHRTRVARCTVIIVFVRLFCPLYDVPSIMCPCCTIILSFLWHLVLSVLIWILKIVTWCLCLCISSHVSNICLVTWSLLYLALFSNAKICWLAWYSDFLLTFKNPTYSSYLQCDAPERHLQ